tara:strand:- start:5321 stop:6247 length:927 start_codon:yes stop_codon:yes gene_type:complete
MQKNVENVLIIGGGIAANSAAIYCARASLKPLVIHGPELDQLSLTTLVENYPGFPEGIMGPDLVNNTRKQAEKFGAKYIEGKVDSAKKKKGYFEIKAEKKTYKSKALIVSTGATARRLGIPGEDKYFGRGVSTCATCDAAIFSGKDVVVVGGGDAAMEETLALTKFAKSIKLIHRRDSFRASKIMQDRIFKLKNKVEIIWNTTATEVLGDKFVTSIKTKNLKTKETKEIPCQGMFLAIGHIPNTKFLNNLVKTDKAGYIVTDKRSRTSTPGIFACGDVQDPVFKQAITSAGTGCQAAIEAENFVEGGG